MAESAAIQVVLIIDDPGVDAEGRAEATDGLRVELSEVAAESIELLGAGEAPPGARGGGLVDAGALLLTLAGSGSILIPVIELVRDWVRRQGNGKVWMRIGADEVEITGASDAVQRRALDAFLDRHQP